MILHRECKFTDPNTKRVVYGLIQEYDEDAKIAEGNYLIEEAVTGKPYVVPQKEVTTIPMGEFVGGDALFDDEFHRYMADEQKKAQDFSDNLPNDGKLHPGALFTVGVGDGYAWYVVKKVNRTTCEIEWRGFSGDRWMDCRRFGWGGKFPIKEIQPYCRRFANAGRRTLA